MLAEPLGGLALREALHRAVHPLVQPPVVRDRHERLLRALERAPRGAARALQHRRDADVDGHAVRVEDHAGAPRLRRASGGREWDGGGRRRGSAFLSGVAAVVVGVSRSGTRTSSRPCAVSGTSHQPVKISSRLKRVSPCRISMSSPVRGGAATSTLEPETVSASVAVIIVGRQALDPVDGAKAWQALVQSRSASVAALFIIRIRWSRLLLLLLLPREGFAIGSRRHMLGTAASVTHASYRKHEKFALCGERAEGES